MKALLFLLGWLAFGLVGGLPPVRAQAPANDPAAVQDSLRRAQARVKGFVDHNGDGYNDNAPDHDGDGVPNGLDPDWRRSSRWGGKRFVDANGDGINDNAPDHDGDGIPNGMDADFRGPRTRNGRRPGGDMQNPEGGMRGRAGRPGGTQCGECSVPGGNGQGKGRR